MSLSAATVPLLDIGQALELPAVDGAADEDAAWPESAEESMEEAEDLGLEGDTGPEEPFGDEISSEEDEKTWLVDSEAAPEWLSDDDEVKEEQGFTQDDEPDASEEPDELSFDELPMALDDSGDEGFGDEAGFDLPKLPPLDSALDGDGPLDRIDELDGGSAA